MNRFIIFLFTLHASLFTLHTSVAQIIHVPADQPTIQAGIDAASDGDTVLVTDGVYFENINFLGKAITVASHFIMDADPDHIANTTINGSQPEDPEIGSVVLFNSGEDTTSILNGFNITGGTGVPVPIMGGRGGGGIAMIESAARITNNVISGNAVSNSDKAGGGGIGCFTLADGLTVIIDNNTITENSCSTNGFSAFGGGVYSGTNTRMVNNIIEYNSCTNSGNQYVDGGGVEIEDLGGEPADFYFVNNEVRYNTISTNYIALGGGISSWYANTYIENNSIHHNTITGEEADGAAIHLFHPELVNIAGNVIEHNNVITDYMYWGAGISCLYPEGRTVFSNNEIKYNSGPIYVGDPPELIYVGVGGGICVLEAEMNEIIVEANLFAGDTAKHGGGFYSNNSYNLKVSNNIFNGNWTYNGAAIGTVHTYERSTRNNTAQMVDTLTPLFVNNTLVGNSAINLGGAMRLNCLFSTPVILNNIFWQNDAPTGKDIYNASDEVAYIYYSDIDTAILEGPWSGEGNFYTDPDFEDGSFHLSTDSECINMGIDSLEVEGIWYYSPLTDFDGEARPYPSVYCDPVPDIGADEVAFDCEYINRFANAGQTLMIRPNPFKDQAMVSFILLESQQISAELLDFTGRLIRVIASGKLAEAEYTYTLSSEGLSDGIYLVRLVSGKTTITEKVIFSK